MSGKAADLEGPTDPRLLEDGMRSGRVAMAAALALVTSAADSADMYRTYSPAVAATGYSWIGPYIGGNLGYRWGTLSNSGANIDGIAGGIEGGYNWQLGSFVLGGEADLQASNASGTFASYKFYNPWFGTLRGRGGFAVNNILYYGTVGVAYGRGRLDFGGAQEDNLRGGWTAGAGLEVGLTQNWSARAEYLYLDLGSATYLLTGTSNDPTANLLRFGVNYRF
jgi:outer membrane immunogenic protein